MTRFVYFILAVAMALATPVLALAQGNDPSAALSEPAQKPIQTSTAEQRARVALRMQRINPSIPVGIVSPRAFLTSVDDAEIDQLRADLISLSGILGELSPAVADRLAIGNFDEDHLQTLSDDQLTVLHNTLPDPTSFHLAVASLRQSSQLAAARQAAAKAAAQRSAGAQREGNGEADGDTATSAAEPDRLSPATSLDGTPLSATISDPQFYTGGCPGTYYDAQAIAAFHVTLNLLNIAVVIAKSLLDAATVEVFGAGNNVPFVVAWGILRVAQDANRFGLDMVEFCDGTVRDAYTDTAYDNLIAIHKNLDEHDMIEKAFLKEFRTLYIRKEVEKNLLLTGDLRISLFQLPVPMMQYEGVGIEVTRDIVLDTIQRNQLAGMPIGNAQTLYNDGVTLLAQNRYKDAYARFRSAYQAAVNQTVR